MGRRKRKSASTADSVPPTEPIGPGDADKALEEKQDVANKKQKITNGQTSSSVPEEEQVQDANKASSAPKQEPPSMEEDRQLLETTIKTDADVEMVDAPSPKKTPQASKILFVGNLSFSIEEDDVKNFFKDAGEVAQVRFCMKEDRFAGYGHVEFATAEAAQKALNLHNEKLLDRRVRLDLAMERGAHPRVTPRATGSDLGREKGSHLPVTPQATVSDSAREKGAYLPVTPQATISDLAREKGAYLPVTPQATVSKTVILGNLSFPIEEDDVKNFFKDVGEVAEVRSAMKDDQFVGFVQVEFTTAEAAQEALKLNNELLHDQQVKINLIEEQGASTPGVGDKSYQKEAHPPATPIATGSDLAKEKGAPLDTGSDLAREKGAHPAATFLTTGSDLAREKSADPPSTLATMSDLAREKGAHPSETSLATGSDLSREKGAHPSATCLATESDLAREKGAHPPTTCLALGSDLAREKVPHSSATLATGSDLARVKDAHPLATSLATESDLSREKGAHPPGTLATGSDLAREKGAHPPATLATGSDLARAKDAHPLATFPATGSDLAREKGAHPPATLATGSDLAWEKSAHPPATLATGSDLAREKDAHPPATSLATEFDLAREKGAHPPVTPRATRSKILFVANLSYSTGEDDIKDFFKDIGEVAQVRFHKKDGRFAGFGHVEFTTAEGAEEALKLNNKLLLDRQVRIELAHQKGASTPGGRDKSYQKEAHPPAIRSNTVFVGNLSYSIGEEDVWNFFKDVGEVADVRLALRDGRFAGFGHVEFTTAEAAEEALKLNNELLLERRVHIDLARELGAHPPGSWDKSYQKEARPPVTGSKTVYLGNLSFSIEEDDVKDFFKDVGEIAQIRFQIKDDRFMGFGHVDFTTAEAAEEALKLNNELLLERRVKVELAPERGPSTPGGNDKSFYQKGGQAEGNTIFIRGFNASEGFDNIRKTLEEHFGKCGEISRLSIPKDFESGCPKGVAFIDFAEGNGLREAMELDGCEIGGSVVTVQQAKPKSEGPGRGRGGGRGGRFIGGRGWGGRISNRL